MSSSATPTQDTDKQTWVYPPPGSRTPPIAQTGNIGPVNLYDKMVLQWEPDTVPKQINLACFSESLEETDYVVASGQGQPFTYQFTGQAQQANNSDDVFCHMYFSPSQFGNTIVWQFVNSPGSSIATWHGLAASTSASGSASSTSTSTSQPIASTASESPSALASASTSSSASATASSQSKSGLSTGASAGIGVGVGVGVLLLVGAILFFWRRQRKSSPAQGRAPHGEEYHDKATERWDQPPPTSQYQDVREYRSEMDGTGRASELPSGSVVDHKSRLGAQELGT